MSETEKDQLILKLLKQCSEQSHAIGYALGVLENLYFVPTEQHAFKLDTVRKMFAELESFKE